MRTTTCRVEDDRGYHIKREKLPWVTFESIEPVYLCFITITRVREPHPKSKCLQGMFFKGYRKDVVI
jgi:hypothetical protein